MKDKEKVLIDLIQVGIIKKGNFVLKSGKKSDLYFDFRDLAGHPVLMNEICELMKEVIKFEMPDLLVGLPYASLPITSVLSVKTNIPMIYPRKKAKDYGTRKKLEGIYKIGQSCAIIDDVISSGLSKIEILKELRENNLIPKYILVVVDREEGGKEELEKLGTRVKCLWTRSDVLASL